MGAYQRPDGGVTALPPYRAVLIVDMKDFSGTPGRTQAGLTAEIPDILRRTLRRVGLPDLWEEIRFETTTGDGYVLGFPSAFLPFLLNPLLPGLQDELADRNAGRATSTPPIRMRVSINVGPMTDSGVGDFTDGSGAARIETHRLLDSAPVRDLLTRSGPATCIAGIVSARVMADAVLPGFADDDPDLYVEVPVQVKQYQTHAYLRVPRPSGDLLRHGFAPGRANRDDRNTHRSAEETTPPWPADTGQRHSTHVGTVVSGVRGPVNTGSGAQFNLQSSPEQRPSRRRRRTGWPVQGAETPQDGR